MGFVSVWGGGRDADWVLGSGLCAVNSFEFLYMQIRAVCEYSGYVGKIKYLSDLAASKL